MTRIAIFLTAVPLAVALATLLNTLLDRRVAAVDRTAHRPPDARLRGLFALLTMSSLMAVPALATEDTQTAWEATQAESTAVECSFECSLAADTSRVEELWHRAPRGVVLVSQSQIPVSADSVGGSEVLEIGPTSLESDRSPRPRDESVEPTQTRP